MIKANSYFELPFLLFLLVLFGWMVFLSYWMTYPYGRMMMSGSPTNNDDNISSPKIIHFGGCCWGHNNKGMSIQLTTLQRFSWGMAGGSLNGLLNFLKDALTIIHVMNTSDNKKNSHNSSELIFVIVLLLLAASVSLGGLFLLSSCMKRYDATYSAAMFIGSYVISASIMSTIHYDTFQHLNGRILNYIMYPMGLFILLCGIYLLVLDAPAAEVQPATTTNTIIVPTLSGTSNYIDSRDIGALNMNDNPNEDNDENSNAEIEEIFNRRQQLISRNSRSGRNNIESAGVDQPVQFPSDNGNKESFIALV